MGTLIYLSLVAVFAADGQESSPQAAPNVPAAVADERKADGAASADAELPEQAKKALAELDSTEFEVREAAADRLFELGAAAVPLLRVAAEIGSPEVAARSFEILQRLYRVRDEATSEAVDEALVDLTRVQNLTATARAERILESISQFRQSKAVEKLERLGAIIHESEISVERPRPRIEHVMFGRDWTGEEKDIRLIERLEDFRQVDVPAPTIYVVKGVAISEETKFAIRVHLPTLDIQTRGPAQLGVTNAATAVGCVIAKVTPDSAADRAGLKAWDQIVEIDGKPIESFNGLIETIGEKEPGDTVSIVHIREGQTLRGEAKLSGWAKKKNRPNAVPPKP